MRALMESEPTTVFELTYAFADKGAAIVATFPAYSQLPIIYPLWREPEA
jgi:hypothetical protein